MAAASAAVKAPATASTNNPPTKAMEAGSTPLTTVAKAITTVSEALVSQTIRIASAL